MARDPSLFFSIPGEETFKSPGIRSYLPRELNLIESSRAARRKWGERARASAAHFYIARLCSIYSAAIISRIAFSIDVRRLRLDDSRRFSPLAFPPGRAASARSRTAARRNVIAYIR